MYRVVLLLISGLALLTAGCDQSGTRNSAPAQAASTNRTIYQVKGVVVKLAPGEKTVTIKHEEVPGYMQSMTMPFDVHDAAELTGLEPGDPVSFRLIVTDTDGWIDQIHKTGAKTNVLPTTGPIRFVRDVEPLNEGDLLPEYHFTNQLGQPFSTAQFKGKALAINFLFTRCPFPTMCPQTARNFAQTQLKLDAMPNAPTNLHFLTISFDPDFDTPAVLKTYADMYHADPQRWTFATGTLLEITAIGQHFGLTFWRDDPAALPQHNLRTVVIDTAGRVQKNITGNEWTPDELVAELVKAAAVK